jgi:hypothetical protein
MGREIFFNVVKALFLTAVVVLAVLFSTGQESRFIYTDF